ncbi:hypothetical protein B0H17DRAFT_1332077 [Mycena rosella]|uniref:Uncharacterized protein n=1 Tax=Mycena rosella TaxID=1033263 RepID=A0AAD7GCR4_MYCRO|nr:hypothetical protein B0H17DRAFT_1332077 [Mycena rosella]
MSLSGPPQTGPLHPLSPSAPGRTSQYPLTFFDNTFEQTTFLTGWLVQGAIDTNTLAAALARLTEKWRVLAGRLESIPDSRLWQITVPLGPLPEDYPTYVLTECISEVPLSTYIKIPLEASSESLPQSVFLHTSTPRHNSVWSKGHPLTCWHITHFPASSPRELPYSCIGFARSHGVFDGVGAASIMRALVAEMHGKEWDVPPPPPEGMHSNPIDTTVHKKLAKGKPEYPQVGYSPLGIKGALWLIGWHLRERYWRGSTHRIFIIPKECLSSLVDDVKSEVRRENPSVQVTTGDVFVAWLMKVIYAKGTSPDTVVHCSNFGSFRDLIFKASGESLAAYPHNAFVPLPYPALTVRELNAMTVPEFTLALSRARCALNLDHVVSAHQLMTENRITMPVHPAADETLVMSNVSASRILETDWSPVGSQGTVCSYRFSATPNNLVLANTAYISGRLSDSSTVLDVNFSKARMQNLTAAIEGLKSQARKI